MSEVSLPLLEAIFNGISVVFMVSAIIAIKNKKKKIHRALMLGAVASSACFLICYLIYHYTHESVPYVGEWVIAYRIILISHIILAFTVPYLVTITLLRAWREKFELHKKIAKITFPIWLYVSVTGIIIYFMVHTS